MAFNFPNAPAVNDKFDTGTGLIYTWDGSVWRGDSGAPLFFDIRTTIIDGNDAPGADVAGTYAKPTNLKYLEVELWGAGGSSNSTAAPAAGQWAAGFGGGGGGYCKKLYKASDLAASEPYNIGRGANTPAGVGQSGGNSTFKGMLAGSGNGGGAVGTPAATASGNLVPGGTATGGDVNMDGGDGGGPFWSVSAGIIMSGFGGAGGGGGGAMQAGMPNGGSGNARNGNAGNKPGGGASGGAVANTASGAAGAVGAPGRLILTEYLDAAYAVAPTVPVTEGTFTPVLNGVTTAGVGTYTTNEGKYIKIGKMVYVFGSLVWTAHSGTGGIRVAGLPFPAAASTYPVLSLYSSNLVFTGQLSGFINSGSTVLSPRQLAPAGTATSDVPMDTAGQLNFSGAYTTD